MTTCTMLAYAALVEFLSLTSLTARVPGRLRVSTILRLHNGGLLSSCWRHVAAELGRRSNKARMRPRGGVHWLQRSACSLVRGTRVRAVLTPALLETSASQLRAVASLCIHVCAVRRCMHISGGMRASGGTKHIVCGHACLNALVPQECYVCTHKWSQARKIKLW